MENEEMKKEKNEQSENERKEIPKGTENGLEQPSNSNEALSEKTGNVEPDVERTKILEDISKNDRQRTQMLDDIKTLVEKSRNENISYASSARRIAKQYGYTGATGYYEYKKMGGLLTREQRNDANITKSKIVKDNQYNKEHLKEKGQNVVSKLMKDTKNSKPDETKLKSLKKSSENKVSEEPSTLKRIESKEHLNVGFDFGAFFSKYKFWILGGVLVAVIIIALLVTKKSSKPVQQVPSQPVNVPQVPVKAEPLTNIPIDQLISKGLI